MMSHQQQRIELIGEAEAVATYVPQVSDRVFEMCRVAAESPRDSKAYIEAHGFILGYATAHGVTGRASPAYHLLRALLFIARARDDDFKTSLDQARDDILTVFDMLEASKKPEPYVGDSPRGHVFNVDNDRYIQPDDPIQPTIVIDYDEPEFKDGAHVAYDVWRSSVAPYASKAVRLKVVP